VRTTITITVALLVCGATGARAQYPNTQAPVYSAPVTGYNTAPIAPNYYQPAQQAPAWTPPVTGHPAPYMPGFGPPLPPMR
jgi:hypothetical protein